METYHLSGGQGDIPRKRVGFYLIGIKTFFTLPGELGGLMSSFIVSSEWLGCCKD